MITLAIIILVPFKMVLPELPYLLVKQFFPLMGQMIMWIVGMGVVLIQTILLWGFGLRPALTMILMIS